MEITMIPVCRDWTFKDLKSASETFKALLGRHSASRFPKEDLRIWISPEKGLLCSSAVTWETKKAKPVLPDYVCSPEFSGQYRPKWGADTCTCGGCTPKYAWGVSEGAGDGRCTGGMLVGVRGRLVEVGRVTSSGRFSTALGERVTITVESIGSGRGPGEGVYPKLTLVNSLLVLLGDFLVKVVSLGSKAGELDLNSHAWGRRCPGRCVALGSWRVNEIFRCWWTPSVKVEDVLFRGLEILLVLSRMLREVGLLNDHSVPCREDLFDSILMIYGHLILSPSVFEPSPCRVLEDCL
ncbi:hypothetical protein CRG98_012155 [Punica granatum]|uniref:Uncharacterized protein n=1 Tax=Punica granatum TaxID=22663 RepID=A0A2I0KGF6_PUNGR|nr:hypothetical protein CRG98_012155 [Punica granatum]